MSLLPAKENPTSYGSIRDDFNSEETTSRNQHREHATSSICCSFSQCKSYWAWILLAITAGVILPVLIYDCRREQFPNVNTNLLKLRSSASKSAATTTTTSSSIASFFPLVDRSEYSSTRPNDIVNPDLFAPSLRHDTTNNSNGLLLNVPFPTGAFWTNLVLVQSTSDQGLSYPIMTYPYAYKWSPTVLQVSYPPLRRLMDDISIRDIFNPDLSVGVVETAKKRQVTAFDPLSVTLRFTTTANDNNNATYWETYLVQGSPFVTLAFEKTTPVLSALSIFSKFSCINDDGNDNTSTTTISTDFCQAVESRTTSVQQLRGTHFQVTTQEQLTWLVVASEPLTLEYDTIRKTTIKATHPYQGVLRLVLLPPPRDDMKAEESYSLPFPSTYPSPLFNDKGEKSANATAAIDQLLCHAYVYPVGAKVAWDHSHNNKNSATVEFHYQTQTMNNNNNNKLCKNPQLLMLALPHHVQVLSPKVLLRNTNNFGLVYRTIKGTMTPVVGNVWSYQEALTSIGLESQDTLENAKTLDSAVKTTILNQVQKDMSQVLPTLDENVYGFGKQVARLAQLAHIASVLEEDVNNSNADHQNDDDSLTNELTSSLHRYLSAYLTGNIQDRLVYDTNFGGIVSVNGLTDFMDDFGNGWYNDHLFHYGYIMYASAVLGKLNATFVEEMGDAVDAILLDVANPTNADSSQQQQPTLEHASPQDLFPFARHKSWFDSHSFASGLFPFADGKSMESSGESVNFYYGAYLWTAVRADNEQQRDAAERMVDWARLLLAMEIRGVKTYWHMVAPEQDVDKYHASDIYNPKFAKNLMVGNVGMMDVTIATWFGTEPLYVHMINFLPVTAITKELFAQSYVEEEFKNIISPVYDNVEMAWKGYVVSDRALVNPTAAYDDALKLRSYELDQAISQSQVLYFASTMDGFKPPTKPSNGDTLDNETNSNGGSSSVFCANNPACDDLGLTGKCCPATNGVFLGCCNHSQQSQGDVDSTSKINAGTQPPDKSPPSAESGDSSSCEENQACADLGLTGQCCPTPDGKRLGCCN